MGALYYAELVDVLTAAGVRVAVTDVNAGWERRARSSGGFAAAPLGVVWHHTASSAAPESDLSWMIHGSDDSPIGNMLLDRDGVVWPIAAGAANTQGKGGPVHLSRGYVPVDAGNSQLWAIEAANNGVGEPWPTVQIDAYFAASNVLNAMFGNLPTDVITHALGTGDGWTDRKIDPATSYAVDGPWYPAAVTSSGTWALDDIRAECARRSSAPPEPPIPPPTQEDTMICVFESQTSPREFNAMFFAECDGQARSIELQWSGDGTDPAVQERVATMLANFGPARPLLLAGVRNNRLHPKHRPSDLVDSLHVWTDSDFAP